MKGAFQRSDRASGLGDYRFRAAAPAAEAARDSFGLGGGGSGGFAYEAADAEEKAEQDKISQNVLQLGRKTFYRRAERWVDSAVTPEQDKKVQKVERFSKEYFELVAKHGKDVAKCLTIDEPVTIELDGQAYRFE